MPVPRRSSTAGVSESHLLCLPSSQPDWLLLNERGGLVRADSTHMPLYILEGSPLMICQPSTYVVLTRSGAGVHLNARRPLMIKAAIP